MARRKEKSPPPGSPAWMATFSDLMNLLLCFFVLLFSMSTTDIKKFNEIAESFAASFSIFEAGGSALTDGILISSGVSQLSELEQQYTSMGMNTEGDADTTLEKEDAYAQVEAEMMEESQKMEENIEEMLEDMGISSEVEVLATSSYVMLNMNGGILFDSGTSQLKKEAEVILTDIGKILKTYDGYVIEIIGHTDSVPINSAQYPDNEVLSMYRAYSVFKYFKDVSGVNPAFMKSSGRGEHVPIADNSTAEGRAQNRRVEIKIYNSFTSN